MAVYLQDRYSKRAPIGWSDVYIHGSNKKSVLNPSSYRLFMNLPPGDYYIRAKAANYFDQDFGPVSIDAKTKLDPVVIPLLPNPSYPFPNGETLIRGILRDANQSAIAGAKLSWAAGRVESKTNEIGEFVIFFPDLTEEDVVRDTSGRRFVKGDQDRTLNINVEYDGLTSILKIGDVEIGKTNSLNKK